MIMDEERLLAKLRAIEALHAGATTGGERDAAAAARERILARLREFEKAEPAVEHRFSIPDPWARKLFLALVRRYGLRPYRYHGQRRQSVVVKAPPRFIHETLWPTFQAADATLRSYLEEVTDRVIAEAVDSDRSEAAEEPEASPAGSLTSG